MNQASMDKAVILARGLGTRMRKQDQATDLDDSQAAIAETGVKAMMPIGRPFLDYVLTTLADAGYRQACLVIGPEHGAVREYYTKQVIPKRIKVDFAIQQEPKGTGDAVAAAEEFADGDSFLVINSDNHYPLKAVQGLRMIDSPGIAVFDRQAMIDQSNVPAERITKFAAVETTDDGYLKKVIEKPDQATLASLPQPIGLSMNCWRFDSSIFKACGLIKPSPRGELELPDAVQLSMDSLGVGFKVLSFSAPVLDLSCRDDVLTVADHLAAMKVDL